MKTENNELSGDGDGSIGGVGGEAPRSSYNEEMTKADEEEEGEDPSISSIYSTKYRLVGIVVHSGQANGGHYYSFIQNRDQSTGSGVTGEQGTINPTDSSSSSSSSTGANHENWFKFDDNEVSEFRMDDDEMRAQCYGGDYTGEVYDNVMKRMAFKKQKRWWNAYILFYERIKHTELRNDKDSTISASTSLPDPLAVSSDKDENESVDAAGTSVNMPSYIVKSVHKKNIKFLHHRHHFSQEYFQFIKKLVQANLSLCQNDTPLVISNRFLFTLLIISLYFLSFFTLCIKNK